MNEIHIREMEKSEIPLLVRWLYRHKDVNQFNLEPFRQNRVRIYVAEDTSGILCFIPIQFVYMYDALAPRPGLAAFRLAKVFQAMSEHLMKEAERENIGQVLAQPNDDKFSAFLQEEIGYKLITRETLQLLFSDQKQSMEPATCETK
jgi:hypothetical protein